MHAIASGEIPSGIARGEGGVIGEGRLVGEQKYSQLYQTGCPLLRLARQLH